MIELHQFKPVLGIPNASPFCMKAEAYLLYRDIPYKFVASSPRKSPSKLVPFIKDGAKSITDSEDIMDYFEAKQPQPLDADLSARDLATAKVMRIWIEQNLFWQITFMRWADPKGWENFSPILKSNIPRVMRGPAVYLIRRHLLTQMRRRGLRADNSKAAYAKGRAQLDILADFLGDSGFAFGSTVSRLDLTIYAFVANISDQNQPNELRDYARSVENLSGYCARMKPLTFDRAAK
jgi:glutathione S-transferase